MADLRPFRAFRPPPDRAEAVACPPYDVIDTAEARALVESRPDSFLHVTRAEVDLPVDTDEHSEVVYEKARDNLRTLIENQALVQEPEPRLYLYAQKMGEHEQVGVVACASVRDYDQDRIKKHEKTRPDKEDDRTRHIQVLGAHDEPVFLTYRARPEIDAIVNEARRAAPIYDFVSADGVGHTFWVLDRSTSLQLATAFDAVDALYVADGHHRSAAASRVHAALKGDGGEHGIFLAVVFPDNQMQILAYNRVVRDPKGRSGEELLKALGEIWDIAPADGAEPGAALSVGVYVGGGKWHRAKVRPGSFDEKDPVACLDASIVQAQVLEPLFDVRDPRRDAHIKFVGGIRGSQELERLVDEGDYSIAFYLYPTSVAQLLAVSDAGLLMPPKSTWFEPKLRSGLFVHGF